MSLEAFSATIQSEVYKKWLSSLERSVLTSNLSDLRKGEQSSNNTDFLLTTTALKKTYNAITGRELSGQRAKRLLDNIANMALSAGKEPQRMLRKGTDSILIKSIAFDTIGTYMNNAFRQYKEVLEVFDNPTENSKYVGNFVHKGHVVGIATNLTKDLREDFKSAASNIDIPEAQKQAFLSIMNSYIEKLEKDDIASSNMPSQVKEGDIYANYIKEVENNGSGKYLVEIQLGSENASSGGSAGALITQLRTLLTGDKEALAKAVEGNKVLPKKLFSTKGSPSFVDMIALSMTNLITHGKHEPQRYEQPTAKIVDRTIKVTKTPVKQEIAKLKKLKKEIQTLVSKSKNFRGSDGRFQTLNLTNLQNLLNHRLHEQIKKNMGTGSSRSVLNYRSGRFAKSAKVERLTSSRDGMLTMFYSYMKYPYATFSDGGAQQYPRSRDPKLLISKSVREIAGEQVSNRMRAVNV